MIEKVVSTALPVQEELKICRNHMEPADPGENRGRISIVTGAHGDELEGQFVCYELIKRIRERQECLKGTVDIYPVLNPLGMDSGVRTVPKIDMDLNRMFPGSRDGTMMDKVAAGIVDSLMGSDICIDVHASDTFVREIPQARISDEFEEMMVPYAKHLNVDLIWINATATVHESTLAYSLCKLGVPALVMEMGLGNRINQTYGLQVVDGIFHLMGKLGLWEGEDVPVKEPMVITNGDIEFIRARESGIFLSCAENNTYVGKGERIGAVVDPLRGETIYEVKAKSDGLLFTLRAHPVAYEGALLARIIKGMKEAGK